MKKVIGSVLGAILLCILIYVFNYYNGKEQNDLLVYDKKQSFHGDFSVKDGYVVIKDSIYIKNKTAKDIFFFMEADMSKDYGLVTDKMVPACEEENLNRKKYFIKANSENTFAAFFKSKRGANNKKADRLPPENIEFEIVN
ncbi:MAG: hypothetical protein N2645_20670 [Clostridia bacterium]|nr:hypothetical protein [Clostridia bacterium]